MSRRRPALHALLLPLALLVLSACGDEGVINPRFSVENTSPTEVQQGELIRLRGYFGIDAPDRPRAYIGGVCTQVAAWSTHSVQVLVPHGAGVGTRPLVLDADGAHSPAFFIEIVGPERPADRIYCQD